MEKANQPKQPSLKVNFIYSLLYQILTAILPIITLPYISRVLGAEKVGIYSYTQAFANYFFMFGMLGVENYGNREIATVRDNDEKLSQTFWEIFLVKLIFSGSFSLIYLFYCILFIKENAIIYFLQFFYVFSSVINIAWFCFGLEVFKLTTLINTIVQLSSTAAVFLFVRSDSDLWIYTFIISFSFLASALLMWPYALKRVNRIKITKAGLQRHIRPLMVLFWPVIAASIYNVMDKLMLGSMSTKKEVGFYDYAEKIVLFPNTVISALNSVIMPRMSNLFATDKEETAKRLMDTVMLFSIAASIAMAFGLAGVGEAFAVLFYGEKFVRSGLFIVLLCPVIVFKSLAAAIRTRYIIPRQ